MIDHGAMKIVDIEQIDGAVYVTCICRTCGRMVRFGLGDLQVIEHGNLEARHSSKSPVGEPMLGDVWGEFIAGLDLSGLGQ